MRLSVRSQVVALFLLLLVMGIAEIALVLFVLRQTATAQYNALRFQDFTLQYAATGRALTAMQSAQRLYLLTGDAADRARFDDESARYHGVIAAVLPLIEIEANRRQVAQFDADVSEWEKLSRTMMARHAAGEGVIDMLRTQTVPRLNALTAEFESLETLLRASTREAADDVNRRVRTASIILSIIPVGQILLISGVLASTRRLRQIDRLKDEFVAAVSHELRTPLTAIRGAMQMLTADDTAVPDRDNRRLVDIALNSCDRLMRIVNDILDISKIEAGKLELHLTDLDVRALVSAALDSVRPVANTAGVHLVPAVAPNLAPLRADRDRLMQAVINLLSNAIKFSPRGGVVTATACDTPHGLAISVSDLGHGIRPEDLVRLFDKFHQLDNASTRRTHGTGLGLPITKAIVERHDGTISVTSTVGVGTTFTITLPHTAALPRAA